MKKTFLSLVLLGLVVGGLTSVLKTSQKAESLIDYPVDVIENNTSGINLKRASSNENIEYSDTFVQYALGSDNNYYLRFATAIKGDNLNSLSYIRNEVVGEDSTVKEQARIEVTTVYSYLLANGIKQYYDGENIVEKESEATSNYYWACYTVKFGSSNFHKSELTVNFEVNNEATSNTRTTSLHELLVNDYNGDFLTYKVEGEALEDYQKGKTNYVENFKNVFETDTSSSDYYSNKTSNAALKTETVTKVATSGNKTLGGLIKHSEITVHMHSDYDATVNLLMRASSACRATSSSKTIKDFYFEKDGTEYASLEVNGQKIDLTNKFIKGHTATTWTTMIDYFAWENVSFGHVKFNRGDNVIKFKLLNTGNRGYHSSDGGASFFNVDYFMAVVKNVDSHYKELLQTPSFTGYTSYTYTESSVYNTTTHVFDNGIEYKNASFEYQNENSETLDFSSLQYGKNVVNAYTYETLVDEETSEETKVNEKTISYNLYAKNGVYTIEGESYNGSSYYDENAYIESSNTLGVETSGGKTYLVKINNGNKYTAHVNVNDRDTFEFTIALAVTAHTKTGSTYKIHDTNLADLIKVKINGVYLDISDKCVLPGNTSKNWYNTFTYGLGQVTLEKGDNVIEIEVIGDGNTIHGGTGGTFNLDNISFKKLTSVVARGEGRFENASDVDTSVFTASATAIDGIKGIMVYDVEVTDLNGTPIDDAYSFNAGDNVECIVKYYGLTSPLSIDVDGANKLKVEADVKATSTFEEDSLIESIAIDYTTFAPKGDAGEGTAKPASGYSYLTDAKLNATLTITINARKAGNADIYLGGSSVVRTGSSNYRMLDVTLKDILSVTHNDNIVNVNNYSYFDGYNGQEWFNWDEEHLCDVELVEGQNVITLKVIHTGNYVDYAGVVQSNGTPQPINIDYIVLHHN